MNIGFKCTLRRVLLSVLCVVSLICAIFACENFLNNGKDSSAEAATTISGNTYTISGSAEEMASGWAQAVAASSTDKQITVQLGNDWVAEGGFFGINNSAFENGALCVPAGKNISLNLFGFKIDRGLTEAIDNGSVIVVRGTLDITDQTFEAVGGEETRAYSGLITGGYTKGNGGGIYFDGTSLSLRYVNIYGNTALGNGGGVYCENNNIIIKDRCNVLGNHTLNKKTNNIYVKKSQKINVVGGLTGGSFGAPFIGVTLENGYTGAFTSNYGASALANRSFAPEDIFFADDYENYKVASTTNDTSTAVEAQLVSASTDNNSAIAQKWNQAIFDSVATGNQQVVKLEENWDAVSETVYTYGKTALGHGIGFYGGMLVVPYGANIVLDLNGNVLDRKLTTADNVQAIGAVIQVFNGKLEIRDSNPNKTHPVFEKYGESFDVKGGVITGGSNFSQGTPLGLVVGNNGSSGVYMRGGKIDMYGGTILACRGQVWGAGIQIWFGVLRMFGGCINSCQTQLGGGGILCDTGSTIKIYGGTIENCRANGNGGGVGFYSATSVCEINGGIIRNNTANVGGGFWLQNGATLITNATTTSLIITGNTCSATQVGGGIYAGINAIFNIKGNLIVKDNHKAGSTDEHNFYFAGTSIAKPINVTGTLTSTLNGEKQGIGITFQTNVGQITNGFGKENDGVDVSDVFFADNAGYKIAEATGARAEAVLVEASVGGTLVCLPLAISKVTYNTQPQNIIEGYNSTLLNYTLDTSKTTTGCTVSVSDNNLQGKNAGTYVINFSLKNSTDKWADGNTSASRPVTVTIGKATYDLTGVYMENMTVGKDAGGASKAGSIKLKGEDKLNALGLTLGGYTYTKGGTAVSEANVNTAGDYVVTAKINGADTANYNALPAITAVLTISDKNQIATPYWDNAGKTEHSVMYSTSTRDFTIYTSYGSEVTITCDTNALTVSGQKVTLKANVAAGTYHVYFKIDKTKSLWFDNDQNDIKTLDIVVSNYVFDDVVFTVADGWTYDGAAHDAVKYAENSVSGQNALTVKNTKWQYSSDNKNWTDTLKFTDADTYTVYWKVWADGYDVRTGSSRLTVRAFNLGSLSESQVTLSSINETYNGLAHNITPSVTIPSLAGTNKLAASDYEFDYDNHTNAGTAQLIINGKNNFTGSVTCNFTIKPMDLSTADFAAVADKTYTGADIHPTTTVTIALDGNGTATLGVNDIEWVYEGYGADYKNVGNNKYFGIKAKAGGNYKGTADTKFNIVKATLYVTLGGGDTVYDGKAKAPTTVEFGNNGANGLLGSDKNTITEAAVLGMLNYTKSASGYDAAITKAGDYVATVDWSNAAVFRNYELDGDCNAVKGYKFTVAKATLSSENIHITPNGWTYDGKEHDVILTPSTDLSVSGIVEGNDVVWKYSSNGAAYSTTMLSYKNVPEGGTYTVHYRVEVDNYEAFDGTFDVKVTPRELSGSVTLASVDSVIYTGEQLKPNFVAQDAVDAGNILTLIRDTDFTAEYSSNIAAGVNTGVITLTGKGNFSGTTTLNFSIARRELTIEWVEEGEKTEISADGVTHYIYSGAGQGFSVNLGGVQNGETVVLTFAHSGTDYAGNTVSGSALPINAGAEYTVSVSLDAAYTNYIIESTQTLSKKFAIDKKKITEVTGITAKDKEYDGGVVAELVYTGAVFKGIVEGIGDELTVESAKGAFANRNYSANAWDVAITEIKLGGASVHNYVLVKDTQSTPAKAKINQRVLELVWSDTRILFNGKAQLPKVSAGNAVDGETLEFRVSKHADSKNPINPADDYKAVAELLSGTYSRNYVLPEDPTTVFEIYSNNLVVKVKTDGIVYDGTAKCPVFTNGEGGVLTDDKGNPITLVEGTDYTVTFSAKVGSALTNGRAVNAGEYTAVITISPAYMWWDNVTFETPKSFDFVIEKATTDISGVTFGDASGNITHTYNGALPKIEAGNLPEGVARVTYAYFNGENAITAAEAVNAGTYTVVASFTLDNNHIFAGELVSKTATLTVNKAAVNLDGINFSGAVDGVVNLVYDGRAHSLALSGSANGIENISYTYTKNSQTIDPSNVSGAGEYRVTATFTPDKNHVINGSAVKTATINIAKAPLTVIANDNAIVYGDAPCDGGAVFNGLVGGESANVLGALSFTVDYARYGNIGEYSIVVNTFAGAGASNYEISYKGGKLTVAPLELQVRWQRNATETSGDFTYTQSGSARFAPHAVILNAVNNDLLTLTVTGATSVAGFGYTAEVTEIKGAKSGNYTLPAAGLKASFDVLPAPKSGKIIWDNATLYYNGEKQLPKAYYYASESDAAPVELDVICTGSTAPVNAGKYTAKVVTDLSLEGSLTKDFNIEKREIFVKIGNLSVNCGQTPDLSKVSWSYADGSAEFLSGENFTITFNCDYGAGGIGSYAIHGSFASANGANYDVKFVGDWASAGADNGKCGVLTIAKASFNTDSLTYLGLEATYDGKNHVVTVLGLPDGVTAVCTYKKGGAVFGAEGVVSAGTYEVTIDFVYDPAEFDTINSVVVKLVVNKALLEVKANDNTIIYGEEAVANGYKVLSGLVAGDGENVIGGAISFTFGGYTPTSGAGRYVITPSGLTAENYEISYIPGALTVSPRVITVTWFDYEAGGTQGTHFTYTYTDGRTEYKPFAMAGGLVNGDTVVLGVSGGKKAAGTGYVARATLSNPNYVLPDDGTASATFDILPDADNVVVWESREVVYGDGEYLPTAFYFKDGEKQTNVTVTVYSDEGCTKPAVAVNAGTYYAKATVSGETLANDVYAFVVLPREIHIVIGNVSAVYGGTIPAFTAGYAEGSAQFAAADGTIESLIVLTSGAGANPAAGTYKITGSFTANANYKVTFTDGVLTVDRKIITAVSELPKLSGDSVEYNGKAHTLTADISGYDMVSGVKYVYYSIQKDGSRKEITAGEVVDAGKYIVRAVYTLSGNYVLADGVENFVEAELTVTKAVISGSISIDDSTTKFTYDGKPHTLFVTGSATGVKEIKYTYYKLGNGGIWSEITAEEAVGVGTYKVSVALTFDNDNFEYGGSNPLEATFAIIPADITVVINGSLVYGDILNITQANAEVTGLIGGDTLESIGLYLSIDVKYNKGSYGKDAGEYVISVSGANEIGNYSVHYRDGKLTVTPRTINADEVEWFSNEDCNLKEFTYTYKAGQAWRPYAKVKDGVLIGSDTLGFTYENGKTEVGFGYTVKITGTGNPNYALPAGGITSVSFDILEKPVKEYEIVWDYSTLYYDGSSQKPAAYYYDGANERQELSVTVDEGAAISAGTYTARVASAGVKLTGETSVKFSIEKRPVYIRVGNASAVYGETPNMQAVEWSYEYSDEKTHIVAGDSFTVTFTYDAVTGVGKYKISGHFASNKGANYAVTFTGGWVSADDDNGKYGVLTVSKADIDLKGVKVVDTQTVYDGTNHTVSLSGVPSNLEYTVTYTDGAFGYGNEGVKNAGTYAVNISFSFKNAAEAANYNAIPDMTATLTVRKANLTIKAKDNAIVYGDEADGCGVEITGFVGGETQATGDLSGGAVYTINYTRYGAVGRYRITVGGFSSDNYAITYVAGSLTVEQRIITVEWFDDETRSSQTFAYKYDGATSYKPFAVAGNLVNGDKLTLTVTGAAKDEGIGHVATAAIADNANYALPADGTASVSFDIIPAANTIVWDKAPLYYNGAPQKPSAYYYDESGARHSLTVTVDEPEFVNAGSYNARVTEPDGVSLTGKFTCAYEILKLKVSIRILDVSAVFGGNIPWAAKWWTYAQGSDEFVGSDGEKVMYNALDTSAVGTFAITASFAGNTDNYDFSFTAATLTVEKAPVVGTPVFNGALMAPYDGEVHSLTVDISGLEGVTGVTYTYEKDGISYGSAGVTEAGEYTVTAHFTADGNHIAPADLTATLTVTGKEIDLENEIDFDSVTNAVYNGIAQSVYVSGTAQGVTGVTYTYEKGGKPVAAGDVIGAGTYTVTAHFTADANHSFKNGKNTLTATLKINPAKITVKANGVTVVYGESARANGYTIVGLVAGDTQTSIGLNAVVTVSGYTAGTTGVGTVENAVTVSASVASANYTVEKTEGAALTVTPRIIGADEVVWYDKAGTDGTSGTSFEYKYDGEYHVPYAEATIGGKTLTFTVTGKQSAVGDNYTARLTAVDNGNFALPVGGITVTFSIVGEKKWGTVIWDNTELYYSGDNLKPTAYYYDEAGEKHYLTVNVSGSSTIAGTYTATIAHDEAVNLSGATSMQFKVLALPVIIVISDARATYGEEINLTEWYYAEGSAHFLDNESFTIRLSYEGQTKAGKYKILGEFRSANSGNYDVKFTGSWASGDSDNGRYGTLTIAKANIDISGLTVEGSEVNYDGKPHGLTVKGLPAGVTPYYSYALGGWNCPADKVIGAGKYDVTITFAVDDPENYNSIPAMTATLTINQAVVMVTALDYTITYGDRPAAHPDGAVITGVDPSELKGTLTFSFDYRQYQSAGKYSITPGGLTSDNYVINFVSGVLTVEKRVITVEWFDDDTLSGKTFKYSQSSDGTVFKPFAVAGNLVNNDVVTLTVEGGSAEAGLNFVARVTGTNNDNYALPADNSVSVTFDVVPASRVIVWDNTQLYYNGEKQAPKAYYFDINGQRVDLTVTVDGDVGVSAVGGRYVAEVVETGLTGSTSYLFNILPREITVTVSDKTAVYGNVSGVKYDCVLTSGSFVGGDSLSIIALSCSATNLSGAGTYAITASCADGNYKVTVIEGTLTVTKAQISVSGIAFAGATVNYDGSVRTLVAGELPAGITGVIYEYYLKNADGSKTFVGTDGVKNAGEYEVRATFVVDGNHEFDGNDYKTATLMIMKAQISGSVEFAAGKFVYDGTAKNIYASSTAQGLTGVTYKYYAGDYTASGATLPAEISEAVNAGVYTVVAHFTVDDNHTPIDDRRVLLTIDRATLTVTATDATKTYGYILDNGDFASGYSYAGLAAKDNFAALALGITLTVDYDGAGKMPVGVYGIAVTGVKQTANYDVKYVDGELTVTPYVIDESEVVWLDEKDGSTDLVYDYSEGVTHTPYAYAVIDGERVELTVSGGRVNAGTDYLAVVDGIKDNANFALPSKQLTARFTVNPKPVKDLHIIWEDTTVYYDGQPHAPKAYYTVDGDDTKYYLNVTVDGLESVTEAGKYSAKAGIADGNYVIDDLDGSATAVFEVLRGRVYIEISDVPVTYGEVSKLTVSWQYAAGSMRLDGGAEKGLSFSFDADDKTPVGSYPIKGAFDGETYSNYEVIFTGSYASADEDNGRCGTLIIGKATFYMSGLNMSDKTVVYNGDFQKLEITNLPEGVTASFSYLSGGWSFGNDGVKNAGTYEVTVSFTITDKNIRDNYYPIDDLHEQFTVTRAPLTVKANDNAIVYGDEASANGIDWANAGFVGGDDEKSLAGAAEYAFDYTRYGKAGTYSITVSGLSSANYKITFVAGTLTVKPREITVSWYDEKGGNWGTEFNYKYDGAMHLPYAVAGNTVNNDALVLSVEGGRYETGMGYVARITAIFGNPNYVLPADGTAEVIFNILPDAYTVVWESTDFVYNGNMQAPKAYYFTQYGGRVELKVTTDRYAADAGEYIATASLQAGDTTPIKGDLEHPYTIRKLDVSIIIHDSQSQYGEEIVIDPNGWSYAEGSGKFTDGNFITLNCSVTAGDKVGVYEGAITCDYSNANYSITYRNGTYTVIKKVLEAPSFAAIDYDGNPHTATVDENAPYYVASHEGNVTRTEVGTTNVTLGLKDYNNYEWKDTALPTVIVPFVINKVDNGWVSGYEFGIQGGTVEAGSGRIEYNDYRPVFDSKITVKFYRDAGHVTEVTEEYVCNSATLGEKFYVVVTVEGSNNFNTFVDNSVEITVVGKLKVTLEWLEETLVYDGFEQSPKAFIWVGKERVWLEVEGSGKAAGSYPATAKRVAIDGTDLSGYEFTNDEEDFAIEFTIVARKLTVTVTEGVSVVYGSVKADSASFGRVLWSITGGRLAENDTRDDLNVCFSADFGGKEYADAGLYALTGDWNNGNYEIEFVTEGCFYEVTKAVMTIDKTGSEWVSGEDDLDDGALIDQYQNYFVTLGEKDENDAYKYIKLKGDKSAEVRIRYSAIAYNYKKASDIPLMTDKQISQFIDENRDTAPAIRQAGVWVVYYRIEEANHQTRYGQWRVLILKNTDYVTITFEKPYQVQYGDASSKNIISELIDGGYISVGGAITDNEVLRRYVEAYAYEDVSTGAGVNGSTGVNGYTIRFSFNAAGSALEEFSDVEFRYKSTNDPNVPDTNVGAYKVEQRTLTAVWGSANFVYDGTAQLPTLKVTGLIGGETVELETKVGETVPVTLKNGDIINFTVTMISGTDAVGAGAYRLAVALDNPNYKFDFASSMVDVTIAQKELEVIWGEKQFIYDGESHLPLLTVGGKQVAYDLVSGSQTCEIVLDNGDTVKVVITLVAGDNTKDAGTYTLQISLDNGNYTISSANDRATVSITDTSKIGLPAWAIWAIVGAGAIAVLIIAILAIVLKKRKHRVAELDEDGFNDDFDE